jgi:hypothetical protein
VQEREGVFALPGGAVDLDWEAMSRRWARCGLQWDRFGGLLRPGDDWQPMREAAIAWSESHLEAGRLLIGFDFHLHEFAIVYGIDRGRSGFLVESVLSGEVGPLAQWSEWPSKAGMLELFAPVAEVDPDPVEVIAGALQTALDCFAGKDGPADGQPRGTAGLDAWADTLDGEAEVDRAGNAYTLAVLQAARMDGAHFLADVSQALPEIADALQPAERAIRDEAQALSPLITLFPFPTGGHGNVNTPGLRRAAAMAIRRAAIHERTAASAISDALALFDD